MRTRAEGVGAHARSPAARLTLADSVLCGGMPRTLPHCLRDPASPIGANADVGRFASRVRIDAASCEIALIGLADDEGVRLNGGRPGAAEGPRSFRAALAKYGAAQPASFAWPNLFDAGDVQPGDSIEQTHGRVTEAVAAALDLGMVPIGIGGGHDLTFPFVRAVAERFGAMSGVYLDAHLDVREEVGSGMPFRTLLEHGLACGLAVHGLDRFATRADHLRWFEGNGGVVVDEDLPPVWPGGACFLSVDLDVLDQSVAPGVSAMNPAGWSAGRACTWARSAGRNPDVRCMDIMELCPRHDEAGRTARVAARLCLEFLAGFAERGSVDGA